MSKQGGKERHEQGKAAEQVLARVAEHAYLPSFCFPNPLNPDDGKEICDMLVVCGTNALIWQVKNIKKHASGSFKEAEVEKAIRQCRGARKSLEQLGKVPLNASNGCIYEVDFAQVTSCHQIAVFIGDEPDFIGFYDDHTALGVHLFTNDFAMKALSYLDTIADLSEYLTSKERLLHGTQTSMILSGNEANLLAHYLQHERTFGELDKQVSDFNMIYFDADTLWDDFAKSDHYQRKQKADLISGGWDYMIKLTAKEVGGSVDPTLARRLVAIMSSHGRVERRALSHGFMEGWEIAQKQQPNQLYRRLSPAEVNGEKVMYVFLWMGEDTPRDREVRKQMLSLTGIVARKVYPEHTTIIGITSERNVRRLSPLDFMLLDLSGDNWTLELQQRADEVQKDLGILTNVNMSKTTVYEFPDDK